MLLTFYVKLVSMKARERNAVYAATRFVAITVATARIAGMTELGRQRNKPEAEEMRLTLYLWGIVDELKLVCGFLASVCLLLLIASRIIADCESRGDSKNQLGYRKSLIVTGAIALLVGVFLPNSKTIAVMVVVPALVESKAIQKDLPELYDMGIKALKSSLTNLHK